MSDESSADTLQIFSASYVRFLLALPVLGLGVYLEETGRKLGSFAEIIAGGWPDVE